MHLSIFDFVQGSGRARRDQKKSYSIYVMPQSFKYYSKNSKTDINILFNIQQSENQMMQAYLTENICYQAILSSNFNGITDYLCGPEDI